MKKCQFSTEQIVDIPSQTESGVPVAQLRRQHGFSQSACHVWRKKYSGADAQTVADHRRLTRENAQLKKQPADALLEKKALKYVIDKVS